MARTFIHGFEVNDPSGYEAIAGTGLSIDATIKRTGNFSLKIAAVSGAAGVANLPAAIATTTRVRFYLRVTARPATTPRVVFGSKSTSASINLKLNADGTLSWCEGSAVFGTSAVALTDTTRWYMIEVYVDVAGSVSSQVLLRIDGVDQVTATPSTGLSSQVCWGPIGDTVADTYTAYVDDAVGEDSAWPGEGGVVLLLPTGDNARGANWTGGAGGTTNLFDAVNNTPPVGTATETNTTQIEHSGGASNSYDANMTSYSTAGIPDGSTINALVATIAHGEDIATGTKLLNFSLVSNPAAASGLANFAAGADLGLLGTWPSNWAITYNTIVETPSVTLGTAPVMRVTRPETASRVASVAFMGIMVDFTPPAAATTPPVSPYRQLLAQ